MTDIARLGIEVDSSDVVQADKDLDNLTDAAKKTDNAIDNLADEVADVNAKLKGTSKAANDSTKGFSSVGSKAGRAGVQIQQFVGQVQGGQNAMLAMSQQAADLGIVMGAPLVGVVVSLAAAIGSVLIPKLLSAGKAAEEVAEEIKGLNDEYETLTKAQQALLLQEQADAFEEQTKTLADLTDEYAKNEETLRRYQDRLKFIQSGESSLNGIRKESNIRALTGQINDQTRAQVALAAQIDNVKQSLSLNEEEVEKINNTYVDTKKAAEDAAKAQLKVVSVFDSFEMTLARRLALTSELTEVEKVLFEVEQGRLQGINETQQKKLTDLAAELDLQKQLKDELKALDEAEKEAAKEAKKIADEELARNKEIAKSLEDQLAGALIGGSEDGFKGVLDGFGDMLLQMAAQAVAADIVGGLFGSAGVSGGSTGNTAGLVDMIGSFAGFFDSGGSIPSGQFGIAGENGPEIIQGPAGVTSTRDTAALMSSKNTESHTVTNTYNINQSFTGVENERAARRASGQAARQLMAVTRGAERFS